MSDPGYVLVNATVKLPENAGELVILNFSIVEL